MSARTGQKTCYHCDVELAEKVDPLDVLGGQHGQCAACREYKAAWWAEFQARGKAAATPVQPAPPLSNVNP